LKLRALVAEGPDGPVDHIAANDQARASYAPFGAPPTADSALRLVLKGSLGADPRSLSLGFELEDDDQTGRGQLGRIEVVSVAPDGTEAAVTISYDSTRGLRQSGVMVLTLPSGTGGGDKHQLRFRSTRASLMPRLLRIAPNALPVLQRATLRPDRFEGNGRAGQTIAVEPLTHFGPDEAAEGHAWRLAAADTGLALGVRVQDGSALKPWKRGDFATAVAEDEIYEVDERIDGTRIAVRFGNGINGRRPALGDQIRIEMRVSAGKTGNIASGIEWLLDGFGTHWHNSEPIAGGGDANDLDALLARLRSTLRWERALATSAQIEAAAKALPRAFGVDRAAVLEGWEPGRRRPAWPATRTLLVTRMGAEGGEATAVETDDWRRAIREQLRPRIALAERLIVATPVWRPLRIRVAAVAAAGRVPAAVASEIRDALALRFRPGGARGEKWPLGRDVTTMAVGGWIRRLPGVAVLSAITLLDESGREIADGVLRLARNELPLLAQEEDDVRVAPEAGR
jgi:predicted phage baseplate assembly protein